MSDDPKNPDNLFHHRPDAQSLAVRDELLDASFRWARTLCRSTHVRGDLRVDAPRDIRLITRMLPSIQEARRLREMVPTPYLRAI